MIVNLSILRTLFVKYLGKQYRLHFKQDFKEPGAGACMTKESFGPNHAGLIHAVIHELMPVGLLQENDHFLLSPKTFIVVLIKEHCSDGWKC